MKLICDRKPTSVIEGTRSQSSLRSQWFCLGTGAYIGHDGLRRHIRSGHRHFRGELNGTIDAQK